MEDMGVKRKDRWATYMRIRFSESDSWNKVLMVVMINVNDLIL